ncbi:MAG TPA: Fic family protein [Terriglobales bacterium]|jgi:cell filamentation protein|nr:Fic family protein [Terriglobales bacterium]
MATDPYVYPGTNILKNLAGIEDSNRLQQFEAISTAHRISVLRFHPMPGVFDASHLQRIHRSIFQDVYSWAGEFRTVDIRKEGEFWFCRHQSIEQSLLDLFTALLSENQLKETTRAQFGSRAGYYMSELNAIHPFREGNGRTQREFIRELGLHVGFEVNWSLVTQKEMHSVSVASFKKGDHRLLGKLIARITTVLRPL